MISNSELVSVFFDSDAVDELYEFDSTLLELIDDNLNIYLNDIDEKIMVNDKNNINFNLGFMCSANSDTDIDKEKFYGLIDKLKNNDLIPEKLYNDFSRGYDEHHNNYYISLNDVDGEDILIYNIERA
ncbi:MAG: hypothetical protein CXT77_01700, partial [uncultured DHVE6 group euryarchaeote]